MSRLHSLLNSSQFHLSVRRLATVLTVFGIASLILLPATTVQAAKPGGSITVTRQYSIEFLGTLGGSRSIAKAMNSQGEVVGVSYNEEERDRAFISRVLPDGSRVMQNLNHLLHPDDQARWILRYPEDINDAGQIVGTGIVGEDDFVGFRLTPDGFTDESGAIWPLIEELPLFPRSINSFGDVAGFLVAGSHSPALYSDEVGLVELPLLYATDNWSEAYTINDAGQVAGTSGTNPGYNRAFRWDPATGIMKDLGYIKAERGGGVQAFAYAMNNWGDVVGTASAGGAKRHAFLYRDGFPIQDLGELGGGYSEARDITEANSETGEVEIVGMSPDGNGVFHPFLHTSRYKLVNLELLIVNLPAIYRNRMGRSQFGGWQNALKFNGFGQICGTAGDGETAPLQAYVLTKLRD